MYGCGWFLKLHTVQSGVMAEGNSSLSLSRDSTSAQHEMQEEEESSLPPLVIISSRVKQYSSLGKIINPGVVTIAYNYDKADLHDLLKLIGDKLKGRKALSIALVVHGQSGGFKLTKYNDVTLASIKEDAKLQTFFKELVSSFLFTRGDLGRLDILNCPVEQSRDGKELIMTMREMLGVPVYSSEDMLGSAVEGGERIGSLFFDGQKLKEWSTQTVLKLEKYERIRTVGKGAYGQAILYKRKEDDSLVILKQINILELKAVERQSVVTEIKILAMLDHPHIISYYDNFEEDGWMMIEMEFADGGSLQHYLKQQQSLLAELEVLTKFSQMVDALNFVHKNNILHRDLKTANIFLTRHGNVKLGDFGISKVLSGTNQAAQSIVGTPYYISPEICEGKVYDSKSDIWSLGCILHELMCLTRPFDGTNLPALVHKIVEGSFDPIKGKYSDELKQLVQKLLQKDPNRRPSASDLHSVTLPPLLEAIQIKEGIIQPAETSVEDDKDMRSFLYYLEGSTLSFQPVHCHLKEKIKHVAVGYGHMIIVTSETLVLSWGTNTYGQLGHGDREYRPKPTVISNLNGRNIMRAECGGEFSIFKNENGILMSCGRGDKGVLGHENYNDYLQPEIIKSLLAYDNHLISCGESHVAVLTLDHKIFTWGSGKYGCLGHGSENNCFVPTEVILRSPGARMDEVAIDISCGMDSTVFITEMGRVFACGNNVDNKIGLNRRETFIMQMKKLLSKHQLQVPSSLVPIPIKELGKHRIIDCSLGSTHSAFLTDTGLVYTFGRNNNGQLGSGNNLPREMAAIVKGLKNKPMIVTCSELATVVATDCNSFHIWGSKPLILSPLSLLLKPLDNSAEESSHGSAGSEETDFSLRGKKKVSSNERLGKLSRHDSSVSLFCNSSSDYISTLYSLLSPSDDSTLTRQMSMGGRGMKKASSLEMSKDIILKPIVIDLVDQKGPLKRLWEMGLKEVKLDMTSSFGSIMMILLQAHISHDISKQNKEPGKIVMNTKLRRSVVSMTSLAHKMHRPVQETPTFPTGDDNKNTADRETGRDTGRETTGGDTVDLDIGRDAGAKSPALMSQLSETGQTWLQNELKEGIKYEESVSLPSAEVSHGWFPDSLRVKEQCWTTVTTNNSSNDSTTRPPPPPLVSRPPSTLSRPASQSKVASIPLTIPELQETKQEIPIPVSRTPSRQDKRNVVKNLPSLKPGRSISDLPTPATPASKHLNIKRVQSSGNINYNKSTSRLLQKTPSVPNSLKVPNGNMPRKPSADKRPSTTSYVSQSSYAEKKTTDKNPAAIKREQPVIETETDDRDLDTGAADNILLQVKAQELKKENELLKQKLAQYELEKKKEEKATAESETADSKTTESKTIEPLKRPNRTERSKLCILL